MKFLKSFLLYLLLLVIVCAAVIAVLYFKNNKETKELTYTIRKGTNGSYVELSQGVTHYELDGPDSGKVVVLIHGFSVPYYIWNGTYEYLVDHGFRVLRYDTYGRGFSDRPDVVYDKDLYIGQLKELIEKLHLKEPVDIAGISFGGLIATDFTCTYPNMVNKVVLIDPVFNYKKPAWPQFVSDIKEAIGSDDRALGQMDDFKFKDRHPTWVEEYRPQMSFKGFRRALVSTQHNYFYNGRESNLCLNEKGKPVLLIWGKEDATIPFTYSDSIRKVLKTEFLPVNDAAHLPHLDQPDIVNPALVTFLKK